MSARRSLSSVVHTVEGVPASLVVLRNTPITAGRSLVAPKLLPPPLLRKGYVVQFRNGSYLCNYNNDGIWAVANLDKAKIFSVAPFEAADLFCGRVLVVLTNPDGTSVRRTILDPADARDTRSAVVDICASHGTSVMEAPAFSKGSAAEKEAVPEACDEGNRTEQSKRVVEENEVRSNEVKSSGSARRGPEKGGIRELNREIGALPNTRIGDGAEGWAKSAPLPSTVHGRRLFFEFVSLYLGVEVFGVQPGWKNIPDQYLFRGPHDTTMAIAVSVMLLDRESALALIHKRIDEKQSAFTKGNE